MPLEGAAGAAAAAGDGGSARICEEGYQDAFHPSAQAREKVGVGRAGPQSAWVRGSDVSGKQPGDGCEGRGGADLRRLRRR